MRTKEEILSELEDPRTDQHDGLDIRLYHVNKGNLMLATLEVLLDIRDQLSHEADTKRDFDE